MANPNKRGGGDFVQNDPNYFNPSADNNQAPNFLGYSRGVDAPRAQQVSEGGADRWSQIGNVWRQTVEGTIDTGIKAEINDKLRKGAEDVRDVATNVILPAELQKGVSEMDRLKRSRDAGTMSDTHYYATLDYLVRKQRQRFPGYGAEIDQAISDITGVVPANALRAELSQRANAGLSDADKDWREYKQANGQYLFRAFGDQFYADPKFDDPAVRNQIYREVDRIKAHELGTSIAKNDIGVASARGELTHDLADDTATVDFWGKINQMTKAGSGTFGASYKELADATRKAKEDGVVDAKEQEQIRTLFNAFRTTATSIYNETLDTHNKEFNGSYRQYMSEGGKAALQKSFDDWMNNFERELNDKDFGTLTFMKAMDEANQATDKAKIRMSNRRIAVASAIQAPDMLGPLGQGIYLNNSENLSALTTEVMNLHSKETIAGTAGPIKDAPRRMGADEGFIKPTEKGEAVTGSLRKTIDVITNGDAGDKAVANAVEALFGPGNQGFLSTIGPSDSKDPARDKKAAREKILLQMTAPAFLEKIKKTAAKTGNTQLMENVARFTEDSAGTLFREEAQNLQSIVTDYASAGQLYFDGTSNQFKIYDYARPGQSKTTFSSQFQNSLDRVNMSLKSLENVYKAQGMKPDEISANIAAFWSNPAAYGINPSAQPNASDTIFDAVGDFFTSVSSAVKNAGSGEGKSTFKPADSRASRMNLGAQDLSQEAIDDMVFEQRTGQDAAAVQAGERPFPVPGRRPPMETPTRRLQEDPEGELKVRMPWPGRMDAGLGDVPPPDNDNLKGKSGWETLQEVADRQRERQQSGSAQSLSEKLARERGLVARAQNATPRPVVDEFQTKAFQRAGKPVEYFENLQSKGQQYVIIDRQTGKIVGDAKDLKGARRAVDNRDNRYGAYRYGMERVDRMLEGGKASMQERAIGASGIKSSGVDALKRILGEEDDLLK